MTVVHKLITMFEKLKTAASSFESNNLFKVAALLPCYSGQYLATHKVIYFWRLPVSKQAFPRWTNIKRHGESPVTLSVSAFVKTTRIYVNTAPPPSPIAMFSQKMLSKVSSNLNANMCEALLKLTGVLMQNKCKINAEEGCRCLLLENEKNMW